MPLTNGSLGLGYRVRLTLDPAKGIPWKSTEVIRNGVGAHHQLPSVGHHESVDELVTHRGGDMHLPDSISGNAPEQ